MFAGSKFDGVVSRPTDQTSPQMVFENQLHKNIWEPISKERAQENHKEIVWEAIVQSPSLQGLGSLRNRVT